MARRKDEEDMPGAGPSWGGRDRDETGNAFI